MKIGLYDPYLDTLGGGERYIFTIASCFSKNNSVYLFWDDDSIIEKAKQRFNLPLDSVNTTANIFAEKENILTRRTQTKKFDVIFFMSDGSVPFLFAPKNFLIFQHPVNWVLSSALLKLKLKKITNVLVYSQFTKQYIDKTFHLQSTVLTPAINTVPVQKNKKENIILTVGRFTSGMNTKKHDVLINAFKKLYDSGEKKWQLVIIGSYLPKDESVFHSLQKMVGEYPITILSNAPYETLIDYYKKSKIYWHAAGYNENLQENPERAEHFGITTVEAMMFGAVPIVINAGGQPEIVQHKKNGILWNTIDELLMQTKEVISNEKDREKLAQNALMAAKQYSIENFCQKVAALVT